MGQAIREARRLAHAIAKSKKLSTRRLTTEALTPELVARFAGRKGKASTTNGLLSALRRAMRFAVKKRWIDRELLTECSFRIKDCDPPKQKHHARAAIAKVLEYLRQLTSSWEGGRLYAFAAVLAYAGLRKMEATWLRPEDVDFKNGLLWIVPRGGPLKTPGSQAPVPCPRVLLRILKDWIPRCGGEWLFPNQTKPTPWRGGKQGTRPADQLRAAGEACGVRGFLPHSLRHSLTTHFTCHWGLTPRQVQLILRHSSTATQRIYVHPDVVTLEELVRDFDFMRPRPSASRGRRAHRPRVLPRRRLKPRRTSLPPPR
jgi:integrase